MPLQRGDFVRVTAADRTVDAMVILASSNGRSIVLSFVANLGGWVGSMPALQEDDGSWAALNGMPLTIAGTEQP